MVRLRLSDDAEQVLGMIDNSRKGFAEHLGFSTDVMNYIFSKGRVYWEFCIGNRTKIEVRRTSSSKDIEYVLNDNVLRFIRGRAEKIGFIKSIQDYFKDELVINEDSMDNLINYIQNRPRLKKKYF